MIEILHPWGVQLVPQSDVDREFAADLEIVLDERLVLSRPRHIFEVALLEHVGGASDQEVCHGISSERAIERHASGRKLRPRHMAQPPDLGAGFYRMPAADPREFL